MAPSGYSHKESLPAWSHSAAASRKVPGRIGDQYCFSSPLKRRLSFLSTTHNFKPCCNPDKTVHLALNLDSQSTRDRESEVQRAVSETYLADDSGRRFRSAVRASPHVISSSPVKFPGPRMTTLGRPPTVCTLRRRPRTRSKSRCTGSPARMTTRPRVKSAGRRRSHRMSRSRGSVCENSGICAHVGEEAC